MKKPGGLGSDPVSHSKVDQAIYSLEQEQFFRTAFFREEETS